MNVYMIINKNTDKTGTCFNIEEFAKTLNTTKYKLLNDSHPTYRAVKLGGSKLRKDYMMIDKVYDWFSKNTGRDIKLWRKGDYYLTATEKKKEARDNEEAMLLMIEQSDRKYGNVEKLDRIINYTEEEFNRNYYDTI